MGDAAFQQKCFDVFNDLRDRGRTIIFVTHDMGALQRFCHRALLLERGDPVYMGEPHEVADRYLELNFGRDPEADGVASDGHTGDGEARVSRGVGRGRRRRATVIGAPARSASRSRRGSRSWWTSRTRRPACTSTTRSTDAVVVATTGDRERAQRPFRRRRGGRVLVHLRQRAGARALLPGVPARPPRLGPRRDRSLRGQLLVRRHRARRRWAGWSTCRCSRRSAAYRCATRTGHAHERRGATARREPRRRRGALRGAGTPDPRAARDHRRLAAVLASHLQHRASCSGSCASSARRWATCGSSSGRCCCSWCCTSSSPRSRKSARAKARATTSTALSCWPRSSCSRSSARRRWAPFAAWSTTRPWFARSSFRGMVIPLSIVLLALFNLCLNLIVVTVFALLAGVRPMLTLARGAADRRAAGDALHRHRDAAVGAVRLLPRHPADLGRAHQVIFYASPIIIPIALVQQHLSPALVHIYMLNPLAVIFQEFRHAFITHATPSARPAGLDRGAAEPDRYRAWRSSCSASRCSTGSRRAWPRISSGCEAPAPLRWTARSSGPRNLNMKRSSASIRVGQS